MRNTFAKVFYELAKVDEKLSLIVADISPAGAMDNFRTEFPERFINTGVAEQIMIGMAAGMSMRGFKPFAYTIATFSLFRPFEFIRVDLCYQNLPVTVVGIGGGITYSTLGSTHHAQEDVSIACALPNMRVIAPCDPEEVIEATRWCADQEEGPVYLRLGKAGEPILSNSESEKFKYGKLRYLRKGDDICIIGYGPVMKIAIEAHTICKKKGQSISVISTHTLKPLDRFGIAQMLNNYKKIIVLEEMVSKGGLSDAIKVIAFEAKANCDIISFNLKDEFLHQYGTHQEILSLHGISIERIMSAIEYKYET